MATGEEYRLLVNAVSGNGPIGAMPAGTLAGPFGPLVQRRLPMTILDDLSGRILDTDSHEYIPTHMWLDAFGESAGELANFFTATMPPDGMQSFAAPVYE